MHSGDFKGNIIYSIRRGRSRVQNSKLESQRETDKTENEDQTNNNTNYHIEK